MPAPGVRRQGVNKAVIADSRSANLVGIHHRPGSFSDRWQIYCQAYAIPYQIIDAHSPSLAQDAGDLAAFLWHWSHSDDKDILVARQIIYALEQTGMNVYPNTATCWHYDDKVAQKYLLEAIAAPLPPTWIFYAPEHAYEWIAQTNFPKVFKLRRGAGSSNVRLVKSQAEAMRLVRTSFSSGFTPVPSYTDDLRAKMRNIRTWQELIEKARRAPAALLSVLERKSVFPRERGYAYFQEYLPGNDFDTRITVIGERAFGFIRSNREADFRASGSGRIDYEPERIDLQFISLAFEVARKLCCQSLAMDFVYGTDQAPALLEISYAFQAEAVYQCPGHWDPTLTWRAGQVWPQDAIIADLLAPNSVHLAGR